MENNLNAMYLILIVYAIAFALITFAGVVVIVIGFGKEKKNLKLAGIVITGIGFKLLVILGCFALYMKYIASLTSNL
ncbi:hypothetical protein CLV62_101447 [Dysgonomonas alginatilytica]|uniref:Uncharacterized protein n=1 Tax=Dysgonomonas alginatilytica TaxID=1605892 RepID=A0A2V3PX63_9BACT|nr:hypothetical protein [Dysgonomonas alginatilytica]PXV69178.1 hypothetical protein CLV62_101447 [Dysgonomonas alginatilytica]